MILIKNSLASVLTVLLISVFFSGCALNQPEHEQTTKMNIKQDDTEYSLIFKNGKLQEARDSKTNKKFKKCRPCTPGLEKKFGKDCKDAKSSQVKVCKSITRKVITSTNNITLIESHGSDRCTTVIWRGILLELCP